MRITAIYLKNFKSFKGHHKIEGLDRNLSREKKIILIGGLNGAGKTTLLEAITLCFYGMFSQHLYPTKGAKHENYRSYICSLLNNRIETIGFIEETAIEEMFVEIHLNGVNVMGNIPKNLSFKRIWKINTRKKTFDENFMIFENDEPIEGFDQNEYDKLTDNILPYKISQFFFFDGEKIQDFARDPESEFAGALRDVLGISLYKQLSDDLSEVRKRILSQYNKDKESREKFIQINGKIDTLKIKFEDNLTKIKSLEEEKYTLQLEKEAKEIETQRLTRISTDSRESFLAEKIKLEKEQEFIEKDYILKSKDYLPFILAGELCNQVEQQLLAEEKFQHWKAGRVATEPKITQIIERIFDNDPTPPLPDITLIQKDFYRQKIELALREFLVKSEPQAIEDITLIHELSKTDSASISDILKSISKNVVNDLQAKAERLKQIEIILGGIRQTEIRSGDSSDEVKKLFDDLSKINKDIGGKEQKIQHLKDDNSEIERNLESSKGEQTKIEQRVELNQQHKKQIDYCDKLREAIDAFQKRYQEKKARELQEAIWLMWNELAQKENQIKEIEIYPDKHFDIKLFDSQNREIDKTKLSAGEKEIYAISLLWALVSVSGKQTPIIIDTPYGRLDSKHRTNLAKSYFPNASHQVFLLSQDEEIVGEYYQTLKPHLARELTIKFDTQENSSKFYEGYDFNDLKIEGAEMA
jgi:DNA sulfur modification protein DndD